MYTANIGEEGPMAQTPTITEAAIRTLARPQSYD